MARPLGRGRPGGPGEVGGQLPDVTGIRDRLSPEAVRVALLPEEARVALNQALERKCLRLRQLERLRLLRVTVGAEVVDRLRARPVGALAAVSVANDERCPVQVVGGEVGAEVRAVPEDRAVLHQPVAEEEPLPGLHVRACKDHPPAWVDDAHRDRRLRLVRAIGEEAEDEEAEQEDERRRLHPPPGDEQRPALFLNAHP
jgi:hypothetical protein